MVKSAFILCSSLVLSAAVGLDPQLHILEPRNGAVYAIKDYSTSSVIIKYDISNLPAPEDSSDTELCFQLYSYPSGLELLPNYCLPRSEWSLQGTKSLNDVPLGTFDLTVFLKRQEAGALTVISNVNARFTIKAFEELLPRIVMTGTVEAGDKAVAESDLYRFFPDHASALSEKLDHQRYMEVASKYDSNGDGQATDITIPFDFGATSLPLDTLHVCADIVNMGVDAGPSETLSCFSTTETSITLYGVKPGTYVLRLVLSDSDDRATVSEGVMKAVAATNNRNGRRLFEKSGVITVIEVKPLQEAMPTIGFLFDFIEAAVEPHMHSVDVKFQYVIVGAPTAVAQVQPCVRVQSKLMNVHSADHNIDADSGSAALSDATAVTETETLPFTCVNRDQLSLTLSKLKVDDHTVTLTLRLSEEPHKVFANTEKTFTVFVRDRVEFVPSYDWQPLHEWHTIPAGLETRLPLSDAARKEAKIPEPWRLQMSMPSPCKYFLRTDVTRATTAHKLIDLAAKQCGKDTSCFTVTGDDEPLSPSDTMESSNFFSKKQGLKIDPSCS